MKNKYYPNYLVSPGDILIEDLNYFNLLPIELSDRINIDVKIINGILKGEEPITREIAISFAKIFKRPSRFWMNLEKQYQKDKERLKLSEAFG